MVTIQRTAVFCGVTALGLICSPVYAQETVKAALHNNTIQLDTNQVKTGIVTFEASNVSDASLIHELVVLKTDVPADQLPVIKGKVTEKQFKKMGEVEDVAAGESKRLTLKLPAGRYVLICNEPGHYEMGMRTSLLVTP
jgi:uncharacterized cupredoxin-like copper-binding protein